MTPLKEACESYIQFVSEQCVSLKSEKIELTDAEGRILSHAVYAKISAPHYYASAMDGVAIKASTGFGATETTPVVLQDYKTVDTGNPVPEKYDCVIKVEDLVDMDGAIGIISSPTPWQNVRQIGEDICRGEMAFPSYTNITPLVIGALAACGINEVDVIKTPVVGIIPTGDEVVEAGSPLGPNGVVEFNSLVLSGILKENRIETKIYKIVPDNLTEIKATLINANIECDATILIAGSSKGRYDYAEQAIAELGKVFLHGVAIRPGKPVILGEIEKKLVMGAPGYPIAAVIALRELFMPALGTLCHTFFPSLQIQTAELSRKVVSPLQYEEFVRCNLALVKGKLVAMPMGAGASTITSYAKSDAYFRVPQNVEVIEAGEHVDVELMKDFRIIEKTISIIGSHDPLFDELADILLRNNLPAYIASSHVGSMGAITAIKSGTAHAGGIHLLDTQSGEYNISYIRKYFPQGGIRLMRGVGRIQGIMVPKNNPNKLEDIKSLIGKDVRYVNRQKGSGTRILFDHLLDKEGIDSTEIIGYDREEMTHFSVAVQIASGGADAGLGVYSAAKAFNLDFIPICTEQYDILLAEDFLEDSRFEVFRNAFCSNTLKSTLNQLGGYTTDKMGEMIDY